MGDVIDTLYVIQYRTTPTGKWYDDPYFSGKTSPAEAQEEIERVRRRYRAQYLASEYRIVKRQIIDEEIEVFDMGVNHS